MIFYGIVVSPGASPPLPEGAFAPYVLVRELGARPLPAYAVRQIAPGAKPHLFVAERFVGAAQGPDGKDSSFLRAARRIATLTSPNLPRVRDVAVHDGDVLIFTELVDGEKLTALWRPEALPLEIALRMIVDVLGGVSAIHNLRDARQQPLKLAHGEISPATTVFGLDGVARVLHTIARRYPEEGARPDPASVRSLAPEVLGAEPYDQRADVYGAGVLLWEALSGRPLYTETDPVALMALARGGEAPRASVPASSPWAKDLVEVAARALRAAPDQRWPTATAMAGELRKAAGLKLAAVSTTAAFAKSTIAERAKARRLDLETRTPSSLSPVASHASFDFAPVAANPVLAPGTAIEPIMAQAPAPRPVSAPALAPRVLAEPAGPQTPSPRPTEVLVAPGIHAPIAEVIELGSESLLDAADSVPPLAEPGATTLDPFNLRQLPVDAAPSEPPQMSPPAAAWASPMEPPAADLPTPNPPAPPDPAFAAAPTVDARPPLPGATEPQVVARAPMETAPSMARESELARAGARRRVLVLGGVGALGGLILVLALLRWATRDPDARATPPRPLVTRVAPPVTAPSTVTPIPPPSVNPPIPPIPPIPRPPVAGRPPPAPAPAVAAAPRPPPAARPPRQPPRPAPSQRPRKPKPAFDPNTL